jgi:hypothetical protein
MMRKRILIVATSLLLGLAPAATVFAQPRTATEKPGPRKSGFYSFKDISREFSPGVGRVAESSCTVGASTQPAIYDGNFLADCDGEVPHNETTIAVNPSNPNHAIGGFHSYQLNFLGATLVAHIVGTTSVTFDGGQSWHLTAPRINPYQFTGDPALTFDARGRIYFANIADHEGPGGSFTGPSVVVAHSDDGGLTWSTQVTVARGFGAVTPGRFLGRLVFNDKEFIAADSSATSPFRNRVYVTWSTFVEAFNPARALIRVPIVESHSDDGVNWSRPREISGFSPACSAALFGRPNECDLNQDSYPVVAPGGKVYVSFENFNTPAENQVLVVSSSNGGATWSNPVKVDDLFDINFPQNSDARDTLTGCALRYSVKANTAADPSDATGNTVYVVWADNRNGGPTANDPTNTDVFLGRSTDGGLSWQVHNIDDSANDQFYPWVAVASDGRVDVGYMDRKYSEGQAECKYGFTLARLRFDDSGNIASLSNDRVDTGLSDAGHSRWFSLPTNPSTLFIGDYNGIAIGSDGTTWSFWTDQRNVVLNPPSPQRNHGQHAVGAVTPQP